MRRAILLGLATMTAMPAVSQTATPSLILYELPGYLGRSVTITGDTPDLAAQTFAKRAQSARVTGSWQICPSVKYEGSCRTLSSNAPLLSKAQVVSVRPSPSPGSTSVTATPTPTPTPSASATGSAAAATVDLDALDVGTGTDGQDVSFYARPSLSGSEISAGSNDLASATAFCKITGASTAAYAGRARTQTSNLVDVTAKTRVRGYALRDVVCRR